MCATATTVYDDFQGYLAAKGRRPWEPGFLAGAGPGSVYRINPIAGGY
jgi:hypothetical protein